MSKWSSRHKARQGRINEHINRMYPEEEKKVKPTPPPPPPPPKPKEVKQERSVKPVKQTPQSTDMIDWSSAKKRIVIGTVFGITMGLIFGYMIFTAPPPLPDYGDALIIQEKMGNNTVLLECADGHWGYAVLPEKQYRLHNVGDTIEVYMVVDWVGCSDPRPDPEPEWQEPEQDQNGTPMNYGWGPVY